MAFELSPERDRELSEILTRYPTKMAACIPALHLCQDQNGWVNEEIIDFVAKKLELPTSHVKGVVTFYTLFNQHPVGKHQVWVCRTLPCALRGAGDVIAHCEKRLGIKVGETTKDGKVTLKTAECLASCGTAPMIQVDKDYHENLTIKSLDAILDSLMKGQAPAAKVLSAAAPPPAPAPVLTAPFAAPSPLGGSVKPPSDTPPEPVKSKMAGTMMGVGSGAALPVQKPNTIPPVRVPAPPKPGSLPPPNPPPLPARASKPPAPLQVEKKEEEEEKKPEG